MACFQDSASNREGLQRALLRRFAEGPWSHTGGRVSEEKVGGADDATLGPEAGLRSSQPPDNEDS